MRQCSWSTSHRALRSLQALVSCLFHVPNSFYIHCCIRVCVFVISGFNKLSCGRRCCLFFVSPIVPSTVLCTSIGVLPISIELSWSGVMWLRGEIWGLLCSKGPSSPFSSSYFRLSLFSFHFYFLYIEKAPSSLQRVDFKVPLTKNCSSLKPIGVGVNGRPCVSCI